MSAVVAYWTAFSRSFNYLVVEEPAWKFGLLLLALGAVVGSLLPGWVDRMAAASGLEIVPPPRRNALWRSVYALATAVAFAVFGLGVARGNWQMVSEGGDIAWMHWRILYHLLLLTLLAAATLIDFRQYIIPDEITVPGTICGVLLAAIGGHFHLVPFWVDWSHPFVNLYGPYIPDWIKDHAHLHGLAWSVVGMLAGGGIVWIVRWISSRILGQEAIGFGDVTLMAMIGSFVGWQPVLFMLALAPLCGIVAALAVLLATGKTYVPFGPYLSAGAVVVLCTWHWLWPPARVIFSHPPTLILLGLGVLVLLAALLLLLRLYRMIPVDTSRGGK
ncbi:MAG TPA: prepilin peptidase [Planctomycetaceae bacterium]|nr:prepilin peptidase [Planctomycetaceae bacterium]